MRRYLKALPLLGLISIGIVAGACGVEAGIGVSGGDIACYSDGAGCDVDSDCCGYLCAGNVCATAVAGCLEDNSDCTSDAECCSAVCASDNKCGLPAGVTGVTYVAVGAECTYDSDCASNWCDSGVCAADGGSCGLNGESCSADSDCCSYACDAGMCSGDTCLPEGETCAADSDCCSNSCNPDGACDP